MSIAEHRTFSNPIIGGFHPDPTICRVGDDYYLVTSTFEYFPGLPVFHSRDLLHWRLIGHAMDRPSQLPLQTARNSGGLFAPALRFHEGIFYVVCTNISHRGNFVLTATDPAGPWSEPHYVNGAVGIDPSLFFDTDGRCWWTGNGNPEVSLYEGHHVLWLQEFDYRSFQLIGEPQIVVDGGSDIRDKPIWIEGPHLYRVGDWYYLLAAEGGTGEYHSEVVFRSRSVTGPYESFPGNPILTNRNLAPDRPFPITCTGHGDLVETQNGEWWMVLLACRPYSPFEKGMTNLARETFLVPVTWEDEWPCVPGGVLEWEYRRPLLPEPDATAMAENYHSDTWHDDFSSTELSMNWCHIRTPDPERPIFDLTTRPGTLRLALRPETLSETASPAFLGIRQRHHDFTASVLLYFNPQNENESAGITLLYSSAAYYLLEVTRTCEGRRCIRLCRRFGGESSIVAQEEIDEDSTVSMQIAGNGGQCSFLYRVADAEWRTVPDGLSQDATILSQKRSGGFVGVYIGLYASSNGAASSNHADFRQFDYRGTESSYR